MPDVCIERISIRNFRGIGQVDIPLIKQNLLFYGENGSGKSAFVDAIEYLLTGQIERFDRRDVKKDQSIPFLKRSTPDSTVLLECLCSGNHGVTVSISYPHTQFVADSTLQTWMNQLIAYPPILRRRHIVGFIEEKGADRLKRLSQIIGLEQVDNTKTVWEAEKRNRQSALQAAKKTLESSEQRLQELTIGFQGTSNLDRISNRLISIGLPAVASVEDVPQRKNDLRQLIGSSDVGQYFQIANEAQVQLRELDSGVDTLINIYAQEFYPDWAAFAQQKANLQNELLRIFLTNGQEILSNADDIEICPFCE